MPQILSTTPTVSDANTAICKRYTPLVEGMVKRLRVPSTLRDDARQEGFIGLLAAVDRYDVSSPVHFAVFARTYVKGAITRHIYTRTQTSEVAAEFVGVDETYEIESQVLQALHLEAWMATLPPSDAHLLQRLYWEDATTDEVAGDMGVSRRRVNQIHQRLLRQGAMSLDGEG